MTDQQTKCIHCERTADEVPLLAMIYAGENYYICPQHLPVVIHKPQELIGKLPGAANLAARGGHDHD
jgi:hypothetical protein